MGSEGVEPDVILCKAPSSLPSRWELAKIRLGFSLGFADPHRVAGHVAGQVLEKRCLW